MGIARLASVGRARYCNVTMQQKINLGKVSTGIKLRRACWNVAGALLFRPFVTKVFRPWRIALLRLFGAQIDSTAEVYASARIWAPWNLRMEAGSCLGPEVICYNQAPVTLGRDACVSQYAYLCTAGHDTSELNNAETSLLVAPIVLHRGAWIGTRAFIGMGVEVGERAVVGACACVFRDVEAYTIVGGNPASVIRQMK